MSTLEQVRSGLGRAWETVAEGWRQLRDRTAQAITHYNPIQRSGGEVESQDFLTERNASRWGLLAADVFEEKDSVVVKLEAPGLEPNDLDIRVVDNYLVIRGEKRVQKESRDGRYHILECAYGAFERAVPLPVPVDEEGAAAKYRHGILRVTLPKHKATQRSRINVKVD